jgi:hypothetical protein
MIRQIMIFKRRLEIIISLSDGLHEIPDNAFHPINGVQNDLSLIGLEKNNFEISRIGNYTFYELPNLSILRFFHITIGTISAKAFDFSNKSTLSLYVIQHQKTYFWYFV